MRTISSRPVPLHFQITNDLRNDIKEGKWNLGDQFPTDKQLMEQYGVSSTTVRRAISELGYEGWLERLPGKGTFVRKEHVEETLSKLTGFFEEMRKRGYKPSSKVLNVEPVELTLQTIEKIPQLSVFGRQKLYLVEKLQMMNDQPVVYLRSYWPFEYGKRLAEFDISQHGLYELAEEKLGVNLEEAEQTIAAGIAGNKEAQYLRVETGFPILIMERTLYSGGRPVELSINVYRADRYKYRVKLTRDQSNNCEGILEPPGSFSG